MSIGTLTPDTSAVWPFHRHPSPPAEPRDFTRFIDDPAAGRTGTASSPASAATGTGAKVGADLGTLLLDLQADGSASAAPSSPTLPADTTAAAGSTASGSAASGSGLVSDLLTFFNDLRSGAASDGVHAHHHGANPPDPSPTQPTDATNAATAPAAGDGPSNLLGALVGALRRYGASADAGQATPNVALSA